MFWKKPESPSKAPKEVLDEATATIQDMYEKRISKLQDRCDRLEAQNIVVPVQQLDLLAQAIALGCAIGSAILWWKALDGFVIPLLDHHRVSVVLQPITEALRNYLANHGAKGVREGFKFIVNWTPWRQLRKWSLFGAPILYQMKGGGLMYRRFQVFSVFFIVLGRTRLCRWRERMFAIDSPDYHLQSKVAETSGGASEHQTTQAADQTLHDAIWDAYYEISARFLYISVLRLQGLWTKSAQYIASRADFMPTPFVRELSKLQDAAPQTPWNKIKSQIPPHILKQISDLEEEALASASIGQVHKAIWRETGAPIVVKVQHPNARSLLLDDFRSLQIFCRIIRWLEPDYGFLEVLMGEWAKEARKELDFEQEARNLQDSGRSIESFTATKPSAHSVPFSVEIPRPIVSTRKVLIMNFCEGVRVDSIRQIEKWKIPAAAVMSAVAQTFAHLMYVAPPFNGDPHPGNIFLRPNDDGGFTLVLLDWGLAKRLPDEKRKAFCQMAVAAATFDYGLLLDAFDTIGLKLKRENVAEDMEGIRFLLRKIMPGKDSRQRIRAKINTDVQRMNAREKKDKIPVESKAYPGEFFFFVRVNELMHGLGSKFGIELPYIEMIRPFAQRGLEDFIIHESKLHSHQLNTSSSSDSLLANRIGETLRQLESEGELAGGQICVIDENGNVAVEKVHGHMGGHKHFMPLTSDSLILGYSCTKAITATLAHVMVAEGYLSYDEPICERVWKLFCPFEHPPQTLVQAVGMPESEVKRRWTWKRQITLRHILTHSAGLWAALPSNLSIQMLSSCERCCQAYEYEPEDPTLTLLPTIEPGSATEYHFISFGWLAAGALIGAYASKHSKDRIKVSFQEVYEHVLLPKLSERTRNCGFQPCGGHGGFPLALTHVDDQKITEMLQRQKEMEAQGMKTPYSEGLTKIRDTFRGKEFLLDQRIWNCRLGQIANCPAAGGRFSAKALASFYADLGSTERILDKATFDAVSKVVANEFKANALQGQTNMTSDGTNHRGGRALAMGYQRITFKDSYAVGHAGIGGSIGFHHPSSGHAIAIMLNKADASENAAARIVQVIADHYDW